MLKTKLTATRLADSDMPATPNTAPKSSPKALLATAVNLPTTQSTTPQLPLSSLPGTVIDV
jgi:hypothetical protein